ncbi:MAG: preprotein translocase subunit SecD, partial [Methanomicrobiales archaeon HGW-Methanomicrobiales-5]
MNGPELKAFISDWRIAALIILILLSLVAIYPHFDQQGKMVSNIQYGLDLQQGSWLQLEFRAEVVGFTTDLSMDDFVKTLSEKLDTEVILVDPTHIEIRKYYSQPDLETIFTASGGTLTSYSPGVSKATAEDVKRILENKINTLGTKDAKVNTLTGMNNVARYIRVELAGVDMKQAQEIVGKQGKFEIRVETTANQTEHVLFGDAIT